MGTIQPIVDYSIKNKPPYLLGEFEDSNIVDMLKAFDSQFNELEIAIQEFFTAIWLANAVGVQLDVLGIHLGFFRESRDDDSYRTLLKLITFLNTGSGEPETLISAAKSLFGATSVIYTPDYPGKFILTLNGQINIYLFFDANLDGGNTLVDNDGNTILFQELDTSANDLFQKLIPSGVGVTLIQV